MPAQVFTFLFGFSEGLSQFNSDLLIREFVISSQVIQQVLLTYS
ncbi:hypothetical protein J699_03562 [Acinetobacter sp. 1000160]|nr:hypothetical protein J522_3636 [Acinetobacter baumannii 146457]EYT14782.1 hypothetical protein J699_03562 [Acinetobacter sp. 1000160]